MKWLAALAAPLLLGGCALAALGSVVGPAAMAPVREEPAMWRAVDSETGQIVDIAGLEQLARDFPDSASVRLRLLTAYIREDHKPSARDTLDWLLARDYGFSVAGQAALAGFFEDFDADLLARLSEAPIVVARSVVFATIPVGARLIEGIVPFGDGGWVATSIVDRALYIGTGEKIDAQELRRCGQPVRCGTRSASGLAVVFVRGLPADSRARHGLSRAYRVAPR